MSLRDCRTNPVSCHDAQLLARLERATDLCVSLSADSLASVDAVLAEDPNLPLAHCLKAGLALMSTERAARPLLVQSVSELERLHSRANARERAHTAAARAWLEGDFAGSIRRYGEILLDYPRDLFALQVAHIGDFLLGSSQLLRDRVAQVLPYWDAGVPGYGYVLGMHAFGLEETGLYERAEATGRRALSHNPRDGWAAHAVAHVMEMQGRLREGSDFILGTSPDWAPGSGFAYHNFWHLALYQLDLGDAARALEIYDQQIRPRPSRVAYENVDASAMLWRLTLRGVDVGERWQSLADDWDAMQEDGHYAFNDVHALLALLGAGRDAAAERVLRALEQQARAGGTNAMMTRDVGLPLGRALWAFQRKQYAEAAELLLGVRGIAQRFGGSNAQRDLIHLTLVEAALRAEKEGLAVALSAERTELKPQSPFNWLLAARAFELAGDPTRAGRARQTAERQRPAPALRAPETSSGRSAVLFW